MLHAVGEEWSLSNLESSWLVGSNSSCCHSPVGFGWTLKPGSIPNQQRWEREREPEQSFTPNYVEPEIQGNLITKARKSLKKKREEADRERARLRVGSETGGGWEGMGRKRDLMST